MANDGHQTERHGLSSKFMDTNMKKINDFFGYDPDSDSRDGGSDADGDIEMGGAGTNEGVVKRLKALNDVYRAIPKSYLNLLPATLLSDN